MSTPDKQISVGVEGDEEEGGRRWKEGGERKEGAAKCQSRLYSHASPPSPTTPSVTVFRKSGKRPKSLKVSCRHILRSRPHEDRVPKLRKMSDVESKRLLTFGSCMHLH